MGPSSNSSLNQLNLSFISATCSSDALPMERQGGQRSRPKSAVSRSLIIIRSRNHAAIEQGRAAAGAAVTGQSPFIVSGIGFDATDFPKSSRPTLHSPCPLPIPRSVNALGKCSSLPGSLLVDRARLNPFCGTKCRRPRRHNIEDAMKSITISGNPR